MTRVLCRRNAAVLGCACVSLALSAGLVKALAPAQLALNLDFPTKVKVRLAAPKPVNTPTAATPKAQSTPVKAEAPVVAVAPAAPPKKGILPLRNDKLSVPKKEEAPAPAELTASTPAQVAAPPVYTASAPAPKVEPLVVAAAPASAASVPVVPSALPAPATPAAPSKPAQAMPPLPDGVIRAPVLPLEQQNSAAVVGTQKSEEGLPAIAAANPGVAGQSAVPAVQGDFPLAATEKPFGDVLVLGLLVNDQGIVQETRIVVPSRRGLQDMGYALAYQNQKWVQLNPPLLPGELRWLELRLDYAKTLRDSDSLIP